MTLHALLLLQYSVKDNHLSLVGQQYIEQGACNSMGPKTESMGPLLRGYEEVFRGSMSCDWLD